MCYLMKLIIIAIQKSFLISIKLIKILHRELPNQRQDTLVRSKFFDTWEQNPEGTFTLISPVSSSLYRVTDNVRQRVDISRGQSYDEGRPY